MKLEKKLESYFILGLVVIIGSVLRIYNLSEKSLWVDEFGSIRDSENIPWWSGHPPLYFIILHFFRYMGTNEFVLRLPSVIFGVSTILLSYMIGKLLFGTKEGLVSAFLLSISTMHIYYSQEARMYSLLAFLSLSSLFFFYKSIREKNKVGTWIGFILLTLLSLYTHFFAGFVVIVEVIFFVLMFISNQILMKEKSAKLSKRTLSVFILSTTVIFMLYLPIIITRFPIISSYVEKPYGAQPAFQNGQHILELSFLPKLLGWFSNGNGVVLFLYLSFFVYGSTFSIKKFKEQLTLLLFWVALPIILIYSLSTRVFLYPEARYLIFVLPVYLLVVSRGIISMTELISRGIRQ